MTGSHFYFPFLFLFSSLSFPVRAFRRKAVIACLVAFIGPFIRCVPTIIIIPTLDPHLLPYRRRDLAVNHLIILLAFSRPPLYAISITQSIKPHLRICRLSFRGYISGCKARYPPFVPLISLNVLHSTTLSGTVHQSHTPPQAVSSNCNVPLKQLESHQSHQSQQSQQSPTTATERTTGTITSKLMLTGSSSLALSARLRTLIFA